MVQKHAEKKSAASAKDDSSAALPSYRIDEKWFTRHGRSLEAMIEIRASEMDGADKGGKRKKKGPVTMGDLSKLEGFVTAELPVLEAVFRLLLIHENKPMDVEQISQELQERGIGIRDARLVRPVALARILDADFHYGITRVS